MRLLISPEEMLRCEKAYFAKSGVKSIDVMERAASALCNAILSRYPGTQKAYFACGPGGNGGDGYACARLLHEKGLEVRIFEAGESKSPDAIENRRRCIELGIAFGGNMDDDPDIWVDCLYDTGLSREPAGEAARLIEQMNRSRRKVFHDVPSSTRIVSADIPSGLNGRTGRAYDPCVCADLTVSFQYAKYGHILQDGLDACGELVIADVGFPAEAFLEEDLPMQFGPEDLRELFPARRRNIHKNRCGHLLIIAGSVGMAGAAVLCTKAALRSGVGLVTVACVEEIVPIIQSAAPCAMCVPLPQADGHISEKALPVILEISEGKSAIAMGPGLTRRVSPEIVRAVLEAGLPAVIDADALNVIAEHPELKKLLNYRHVITPHPGEAARLLGRTCGDPMEDALELAANENTAVLKGASRVISNGSRCAVSVSGSSCMARGGSGDVLTGLLGGILAQPSRRTPFGSAQCACEIHGLAGEMAAEAYGAFAANAADLIEFLPEVFKKYVG